MRQMFAGRVQALGSRRVWAGLALGLLLLLPILSHADLAPQLQRSLNWLSSRVQALLVQGEDQARGTVLQVRSETLQTLGALASLPAPLASSVFGFDAEADADIETLARRLIAGAQAQRQPAELQPVLDELLAHQNADGGFGPAPHLQSSALDTAWALLAQAQLGLAAGAQRKPG